MMRTRNTRKPRPSVSLDELWRFRSRSGVEVRTTLSHAPSGIELSWYVGDQLSGSRQFTSHDSALECADRMRLGLLADENLRAIAAAIR